MVTGAEKCATGVNSLEPVVADRDASGHFAASVSQVSARVLSWIFWRDARRVV